MIQPVRSLRRSATTLATAALNFVYPPACLFCGRDVESARPGFCETCLATLKPAISNECPHCGAPVGPYTDVTKGCGQCRRESYAFDLVIRLGIYDGDMRLACLRAKATSGSGIARALADVLVDQKIVEFGEAEFDFVIPVPEHWSRRLLHPYYAAETISRQIARRLDIRWSRSILCKTRRTPKQATSPTPQRRQQQQGSFAVGNRKHVAGKTFLLVDDILTTGSTATAAAQSLKKAGAKRVVVAVIAVSPLKQ